MIARQPTCWPCESVDHVVATLPPVEDCTVNHSQFIANFGVWTSRGLLNSTLCLHHLLPFVFPKVSPLMATLQPSNLMSCTLHVVSILPLHTPEPSFLRTGIQEPKTAAYSTHYQYFKNIIHTHTSIKVLTRPNLKFIKKNSIKN